MSTTAEGIQLAAEAWPDESVRETPDRRWPIALPAIGLGVIGALVQVISALAPSLAAPVSLVFLAAISTIGLVAVARTRRADWWLATLIVVLSMFPNSSVNPDLRVVAGGFRIFTRLVAGIVSPWDVLLGILLGIALWMRIRSTASRRPLGRSTSVFLLGIALVGVAGVANGFVHALILNYGPTSFRSVVQQGLPIYYLFAALVIGHLAIVDSQSLWKTLWAIRLSALAVLVEGAVLLLLSLRGQFPSLLGFLGIPIVLYDQLTILNVFVCLTVARYAAGLKLRPEDWLMLAGGVLFMLMSTRRLVLIMLLFNVAFVFVLAVRRGTVIRSTLRMIGGTIAVLVVVTAAAEVAAPRLIEAIGVVVRSIDLTSEAGQAMGTGGALRIAELKNMFLNLGSGITPTWIVGRGVGTYWLEYVPTELRLDAGSAAFVEAQLAAGAQGWWPGFHLPFVTLLYRFGIVGTAAIWLLVAGWVLRWRGLIRGLSGVERAFAVMVVVLTAGQFLVMGESFDSSGTSLQGFLVAALGGLVVLGATAPSAPIVAH